MKGFTSSASLNISSLGSPFVLCSFNLMLLIVAPAGSKVYVDTSFSTSKRELSGSSPTAKKSFPYAFEALFIIVLPSSVLSITTSSSTTALGSGAKNTAWIVVEKMITIVHRTIAKIVFLSI